MAVWSRSVTRLARGSLSGSNRTLWFCGSRPGAPSEFEFVPARSRERSREDVSGRVRKKLGECLIQAGLMTEHDLQVAIAEHQRTGERVGAVLVRLKFATEKQITKALAYQLGFPFVSLSDDPPQRAALAVIPKEIALARGAVAVKLERDQLTVAMSDPLLFSLVQDLQRQTGYRIRPVVATRSDIL